MRNVNTQLNIRISLSDLAEFDAYAAELGLDRTGLANVIIRRRLAKRDALQLNTGLLRSSGKRTGKITAHLSRQSLAKFVSCAELAKLSRSSAAAVIMLDELQNRSILTGK